ncbi:hypothetical protein F511_10839 [Dorcoceras hygrometricum]|uniref:Uncharacterized protein n=1 Tax=Dorcoceras hygrometricum TaxID=472368 RepID=A0A2Z7CPW8_9LAMI|nr:hypothetical protein F511_10839 [Dorcoceras hygrometricum]
MTFRVVRTNQYNQDLRLIHSTNGNHLESPNEGSSIDHQPQATGNQTQATGNQTQATGNQTQATGNQTQATGNQTQATGNQTQATGNQTQATGNQTQATRNQTQATVELTIVDIYSQLDNQQAHANRSHQLVPDATLKTASHQLIKTLPFALNKRDKAAAGYKHATSFHLTQRIQISLKRRRLGISRHQNTLRLDFTKSTSSHHETRSHNQISTQKYENFQNCLK